MGLGRRAHKPSGDIWAALGKKAVPNPSRVLHDHAVPGCHLWRRYGEVVPETWLWDAGWWNQCCGFWLLQACWAWCWDSWHFCSCLHCSLCNWCQEKCQRLTCSSKYSLSVYIYINMWVLFYISSYIFLCQLVKWLSCDCSSLSR